MKRSFLSGVLCLIFILTLAGVGETAKRKQPRVQKPKVQQPKIEFSVKALDEYSISVEGKTNFPDGTTLGVSLSLSGMDKDELNPSWMGEIKPKRGAFSYLLDTRKYNDFFNIDGEKTLEWMLSADYTVEVYFDKEGNEKIAKNFVLDLNGVYCVNKRIHLDGNGKGKEELKFLHAKAKCDSLKRDADLFYIDRPNDKWGWDAVEWQKELGDFEEYHLDGLNPKIFTVFYFNIVDTSFLVDTNRDEVLRYKEGRASKKDDFELTLYELDREEIVMTDEEKHIRDYVSKKVKEILAVDGRPGYFQGIDEVEIDLEKMRCVMFVFVHGADEDLSRLVGMKAAQSAIEALMSLGHDPYKEEMMVRCTVAVKAKTVTGRSGMRLLGAARYSSSTDSLRWELRD